MEESMRFLIAAALLLVALAALGVVVGGRVTEVLGMVLGGLRGYCPPICAIP